MKTLKERGFYRGVNLGGWMSQCDYSEERLDAFITEPDFAQIAAWGFDHVRLPLDYNVLLSPDGQADERGFRRVDAALALCRRYGLNTVLDLHKTPGFSFDSGEGEAGFFSSPANQETFYRLWEALAERFGGRSDCVMFDLLNEVTEPAYLEPWLRISRACVRRVRRFAPDVPVLLGSYHHNGVRELDELPPPFDENVLYSFHCYEPHFFTHQGAYWCADFLDIERRVPYAESGASAAFFEALFAPAAEKAAREGTQLYCGEYGVIDVVPPAEALPWYRAIHEAFERFGIARCVWSYKQMDFGLSDPRLDGIRDELLAYL